MQRDGRYNDQDSTSHSNADEIEARDGAGRGEPSAPERRAGRQGASRDMGERMTELDRAGTVEETHDRKAGGNGTGTRDGAGTDDADSSPRSFMKSGRGYMTLGLAASSLALLAGTRGGGAGAAGSAEADALEEAAEGFKPPEQVTAEEGVKWDLHVSEHERIDFFVEFLMGRNYDKTREWIERIGKYGPMIQNELRERGMPEDLLYLAMIESGLNPTAYSKAHASGLWQFISETGQRYGLEVSDYVDERRDPVKSTAAGLTYLQEMYDRFDSWYLSSAGYNTGENRVGRLMRERTGSERGSDEGYWDIWDRLPRETRDYVPLMIAMGHIAKEPGKYGFHNLQYQEPLAFQEVIVPGGTQLSEVARVAGVSTDVIEDLNPHFLRGQTPPDRRMAVRVPVGQQAQVAAALNGEASNTNAAFAE
ncbi:MAG TPA: lytic transglycosylase domain-containing protein [Longimicrobiales bacterium]|nr:lytic transglycosylase domain-containing protein [Longimicrobiales bacterium]